MHGGSAHTHQHVLAVMMPCPRGSSCPLPALWQLSEISRAGQHNIACKISLRKFCVRTLDEMIISADPTSPLSCGGVDAVCARSPGQCLPHLTSLVRCGSDAVCARSPARIVCPTTIPVSPPGLFILCVWTRDVCGLWLVNYNSLRYVIRQHRMLNKTNLSLLP